MYKKGKISDSYYQSIKGRIDKYVIPYIGSMPLSEVRELHIQEILNRCAGMSKSHIHKLKINMSEMFSRAVSNRYIFVNPCSDIKTPDAEQGTHRSLTERERELFLLACEKLPRYGPWGKLLLYTGIRPQESAALTVGDADLGARRLTVSRALKSEGVIGDPKTKSGVRKIPLPKIVLDDVTSLTAGRDDNNYLFVRDGGAPLSKDAIKHRWSMLYDEMRRLAAEHGSVSDVGDDLTLYCLRHTYCTDMLRAGIPITTAKVLMGHSSTAMVDKIYGHHTPDQTDAAENMLNALYLR